MVDFIRHDNVRATFWVFHSSPVVAVHRVLVISVRRDHALVTDVRKQRSRGGSVREGTFDTASHANPTVCLRSHYLNEVWTL